MKQYRTHLKSYFDDLAKRIPAPGGGSAACVLFCLGTSLLQKAINYSLSHSRALKKYPKPLEEIKKKIFPLIDRDGAVFTKLLRAKGEQKKKFISESEKIIIDTGRACLFVFSLAKKADSGIKKSIRSDFYIGKTCLFVALKGCVENLLANRKMFKTKSRYIHIFKKALESWE